MSLFVVRYHIEILMLEVFPGVCKGYSVAACSCVHASLWLYINAIEICVCTRVCDMYLHESLLFMMMTNLACMLHACTSPINWYLPLLLWRFSNYNIYFEWSLLIKYRSWGIENDLMLGFETTGYCFNLPSAFDWMYNKYVERYCSDF